MENLRRHFINLKRQLSRSSYVRTTPDGTYFKSFNFKRALSVILKIASIGRGEKHFTQNLKFRFGVAYICNLSGGDKYAELTRKP